MALPALTPFPATARELAVDHVSVTHGRYELLADGAAVGRLDEAFTGSARAETCDGAWRFHTPLVARTTSLLVADATSDEEVLHFRWSRSTSGAQELTAPPYLLHLVGGMPTEWEVHREGAKLARATHGGVIHGSTTVALTPHGWADDRAGLIALLVVHMTLSNQEL